MPDEKKKEKKVKKIVYPVGNERLINGNRKDSEKVEADIENIYVVLSTHTKLIGLLQERAYSEDANEKVSGGKRCNDCPFLWMKKKQR